MVPPRIPLNITVDEEIILKHLIETDAPDVFALTDRNRLYLRQWLPWVDGTKSVEDTLLFIGTSLDRFIRREAMTFGIWHRSILVGVISYIQIDWRQRSTQIGYWISEDAQGKGIITRACRCLIQYAFESLYLLSIQIRCASENKRSRTIPLRIGLREVSYVRDAEMLYGRFVDHVIYEISMLRWIQLRNEAEHT
jgi:ribosomal-protein-serine acetyltransferase